MKNTKHTPAQWTALVHAAVEKVAAHPAYKENLLMEAMVADAAPDLLKALEEIIAWDKQQMRAQPTVGIPWDLHTAAIRAIAKAKGE